MAAFRSAYETVVGVTPSNDCIALLVAHSALETGRWKSIHCFNLGNEKASQEYAGLYCQFRCNEVINGKVQWFDPPHPQCNFRAFQSLESGAIDHLRFLSQRERYAKAWLAAKSGDPAAFVHALKAGGYFTADEGPYLSAVKSLFEEYRRLAPQPASARPTVWIGHCDLVSGAELQTLLNAHGEALKVDGHFGKLTDEAVSRFQARRGLTTDGIVGSRTWTALETPE
jgi:hypothetical protein